MQDRSDLPWEEIRSNTENLRRENETARNPTSIKNDYLDEIQQVNDALEQGAQIALRVAHGFICQTSELHQMDGHPDDCVLRLKKVSVAFRRESNERVIAIALLFWDETHQEEAVWNAITVQPRWDSIVKQAQEYQEKRAKEPLLHLDSMRGVYP